MNTGNQAYRKLEYFYKNKILVHLKTKGESWYNGKILELNKDKNIVVLDELKNGVVSVLLEEVKVNTITSYKRLEK